MHEEMALRMIDPSAKVLMEDALLVALSSCMWSVSPSCWAETVLDGPLSVAATEMSSHHIRSRTPGRSPLDNSSTEPSVPQYARPSFEKHPFVGKLPS